jgi:hypothetical protein
MAKKMELNCNTLLGYMLLGQSHLSTLFGVLHKRTKTYLKDNLLMMYISLMHVISCLFYVN